MDVPQILITKMIELEIEFDKSVMVIGVKIRQYKFKDIDDLNKMINKLDLMYSYIIFPVNILFSSMN